MRASQQPMVSLQARLGLLAMRFRSIKDESEREKVAAEYGHVVDDLIASGEWQEMPAFEDMLPDERMPESFFKFWSIPVPHKGEWPQNGRASQ